MVGYQNSSLCVWFRNICPRTEIPVQPCRLWNRQSANFCQELFPFCKGKHLQAAFSFLRPCMDPFCDIESLAKLLTELHGHNNAAFRIYVMLVSPNKHNITSMSYMHTIVLLCATKWPKVPLCVSIIDDWFRNCNMFLKKDMPKSTFFLIFYVFFSLPSFFRPFSPPAVLPALKNNKTGKWNSTCRFYCLMGCY